MKKTYKLLPIANVIALIITIAVNYIANAGLLNGNSMKTISDRYFNYFTPAGFAFSIWGVIYLGLLGFVLYTSINVKDNPSKSEVVSKIGWWFVVSCLANASWVVAWLTDNIGLSVLIMLVLLFSLVKIIINTRMELDGHPLKAYLFIYWPFAIYSGWITVALVADVSAFLTKLEWQGWGIGNATWAIIMVAVAGLVNILMIYFRNLREFGVVGIWALFAISVSNKANPGGENIVWACYAVMLILLLFIIQNGMKSKRRSVSNM